MSATLSPAPWIPSAWSFSLIQTCEPSKQKATQFDFSIPGLLSPGLSAPLWEPYHLVFQRSPEIVLFLLFIRSTSNLYRSPQVPDFIHHSFSRSKTKTRGSRQELLSFPSICKCVWISSYPYTFFLHWSLSLCFLHPFDFIQELILGAPGGPGS